MIQQILAIIIILFFLSRLFWQKKRQELGKAEFTFWLIFWLCGLGAIIFIKKIDLLLVDLGFSARGIDVLFYMAVIVLFYFVLRVRIRLERIEKNITVLTRQNAKK